MRRACSASSIRASASTLDTAVTWSHRFNQFVTLRTRLPVPAPGERLDAALRQSSSTCRAPPALPATIRNRSTGVRRRWSFRAASPASRPASTCGRTSRTHAFTAESIVANARRPQPHARRRVAPADGRRARAAERARQRSASTVRSPDRIWRTFCWARPTPRRSRSGTPTRSLRGRSLNAYVTDDWRINPTADRQSWRAMGIRVAVQRRARIASSISMSRRASRLPLRSSAPRSRPDWRGVQPRLGLALRPVAGSSLVIRGGMGHLSQHGGLSVDRVDARAAAAAVEGAQHREHGGAAVDAGQWIQRAGQGARRTRSRSIRIFASATRTTGRCPCSAICRRR